MKRNDFYNLRLRARAFLGWKDYQFIGLGAIDSQHVLFVTSFFDAWQGSYPPGHPKAGQPRTLKDAVDLGMRFGDPTAPLWNHSSDIVIYGADDLLWQDTLP